MSGGPNLERQSSFRGSSPLVETRPASFRRSVAFFSLTAVVVGGVALRLFPGPRSGVPDLVAAARFGHRPTVPRASTRV